MKRPTKIVTAPPQLLAEWIDAAADLLQQGWCQRNLALDKTAAPTGCTNALACRFCCQGALFCVLLRAMESGEYSNTITDSVIAELEKDIGRGMMGWNDDPGRTQQEVVAAFRFTADRLRASTQILLKEAV